MANFNPEAAFKTLDQRLTAVERAVESLKKSSGADPGAARQKATDDRLKANDLRLSKLENTMKTMKVSPSQAKVMLQG